MSSTDVAGRPILPRRGFTDHSLFGMGVFVFTEIMLFSAFVSAFLIVRHSAVPGSWPPAGQPRLPFESTALNTLALLASGACTVLAQRAFRRGGAAAVRVLVMTVGWMMTAYFFVR
ncbi:MAG: cytochrome c oxidase subunit 3 [Candidatus Eisenbacteria bacterium]